MSGPPSAKRAKTYENGNIKLYRSYKYQDIPDIAFYGRSKEEIKSYIKDEMVKQGSYSPSYYEFTLDNEYKLLDLSSEEGQNVLTELFESENEIMSKAFQLEHGKYIRKSDGKGDDEKAFELIRNELSKEDKSKSYVGTMTLPSVRLSHSEIVIFNKDLIAKLNSEANKKTDIVVTPKVIRKQRRSKLLGKNTSKTTLSFNNSSESETENVEELPPLSLNFPLLFDNTQDNIEGSPVKERKSRIPKLSGVVPKKLFGGGKRRSVKKSKNQKKTKRNNSTKNRRRTKKKKSSKN